MNDRIVLKSELDSLKKNCEFCVDDLKMAIRSYRSNANELNSVISNLKKIYDTEGGKYKTKDIQNIDVLGDSFDEVLNWVDGININYATYTDEY